MAVVHARPTAAGRQGAGRVRADLKSTARRPHLPRCSPFRTCCSPGGRSCSGGPCTSPTAPRPSPRAAEPKMTVSPFHPAGRRRPLKFASFPEAAADPSAAADREPPDARVHDRGGAAMLGRARSASGASAARRARAPHRGSSSSFPRSRAEAVVVLGVGNRRGRRVANSVIQLVAEPVMQRRGLLDDQDGAARAPPRKSGTTTGNSRSDTTCSESASIWKYSSTPWSGTGGALGRPHRDVADAALAIGAPPADRLSPDEVAEVRPGAQRGRAVSTRPSSARAGRGGSRSAQAGERIAGAAARPATGCSGDRRSPAGKSGGGRSPRAPSTASCGRS